jgi:penicillin amidase
MFGGKTEFRIEAKTPTGGIPLKAKVYNDDRGMKYVEGETFEDAIFGQGFAQCRDRLWQMNFLRALSSGRLAELIGPDGYDIDVLIRMFGLS